MAPREKKYFTLPPDLSTDIEEVRKWETVVTTSLNDTEQRAGLRSFPVLSERFAVTCLTAKESSYLERFIANFQSQQIGMPFWPDMTRLTSDAVSADVTLYVEDTTGRDFGDGFSYYPEIIVIDAVTGAFAINRALYGFLNEVGLAAELGGNFSQGAFVVPLKKMRMDASLTSTWATSRVSKASIEAVETMEATTTTTTTAP